MKRIMIASVASLLCTTGLAFAHGAGGKGLTHFDRDGNGVVTRDEMKRTAIEDFDKADTNKDGKLSVDEIQAAGKERAAKHFAEKDTNKDGKLSRTEVSHMPDPVFAKLDENKDGQLSPDELAKARAGHQGHMAEHMQRVDTDHDGAISRDEMLARVEKRFSRLDTNNDGVISQDEAKAHHGHGPGGDVERRFGAGAGPDASKK